MGNEQSYDWHRDFQIVESPSPIKRAINKRNQQRFQFISLFPHNKDQLHTLQNKIKLRSIKSSPFLLPLSNYWVKEQFTSCGGKPKFDLLFKSGSPLQQYLTYRRVKKQLFAVQQIQYIILQVSNALNDIREMKEDYGCVNFNNIVIDHEVKLKDPLLVREEESWLRRFKKVQGFPSPQKLYTLFDALSSFQQHTSDLFSLGMVCLQLVYIQENISQLYKNANSRYLNCTIDINQLRNYTTNIREESLRNYITVLTHQQPTKRLAIYQLISQKKIVRERVKILQQNPFQIIQENKNNCPNPEIIHKVHAPSIASKPVNEIRQPEIIPLKQSQKPSQIQFNNYRPIVFEQNKSHISFKSPSFQPITNQLWKPTQIFESSFKKVNEDNDNFTPINKINDYPNSFKSVKFDFPQISKTLPSYLPSIPPYKQRNEFGMQRILPKYIDNTYRTSFIPFTQTHFVASTQIFPKETQSIPVAQTQVASNTIEQNQPLKSMKQPLEQIKGQLKEEQIIKQNHQQALLQGLKNMPLLLTHQQQANQENHQNQQKQQTNKPIESTQVLTSLNEINKPNIPINNNTNNQQEGFVIEQYQIGTRYEGYKKDGMRNGEGQFIYKQGSKYKGNWKDNKMSGYGTLYYPSGIVAYQGEWQGDQFHGYGTVYNDNPVPIKGTFDFTNFNALGEEWVKYVGYLKNDAKQGEGILYLTNGEYFTGNFMNDFVDGQGKFKKSNGSVVKGVWSQGLLKRIIYQ